MIENPLYVSNGTSGYGGVETLSWDPTVYVYFADVCWPTFTIASFKEDIQVLEGY